MTRHYTTAAHGSGNGRNEGRDYTQRALKEEDTPEERARELAARDEADKKTIDAKAKWEGLFK